MRLPLGVSVPRRAALARAVALALAVTAAPAAAQSGQTAAQASASAPAQAPAGREYLTGDWGGGRSALASRGVTLGLDVTGFYQGLLKGAGDDEFETGGRADLLFNVDTGKLGLWPGGGLHTHVEYRFGPLSASRGGALFPVNTGMVLPAGEKEEIVASSLYISQAFGKSVKLLAGKINAVDLLASDPFFGGWGTQRFMDIAFVAPPSGVLPPVIMGGLLSFSTAPYVWTVMVYDPNDRTSDYAPGDLFSDGVNLSAGVTWYGAMAGRSTSLNLTGIYSTKDGADFEDILLPPELKTEQKQGSYNVSVKFTHILAKSQQAAGKGLGFYGKAAIADGNPNPIRASFAGGLAGQAVIPSRPRDQFGIGYYFYNLSDVLQSTVSPLAQFNDEQGFELFYDCAISRWLHVAADLQWINPATGGNPTAVVGGLRARISF